MIKILLLLPLLVFTNCAKLSMPTPPNGSSTVASTFPTVSSVSVSSGSVSGGTSLTITGTGFKSGATVMVGGSACVSLQVLSETQITCVTSSHTAGVTDVVVTNSDSLSSSLASAYTYRAAPTVTSVTPNTGTNAGGASVTVTGTGFVSGASVDFGGSACGSVSVTNSTTITCTTSAHANGAVTVTVTNADTQNGNAANAYTYATITNPTVSSITPSSGVLTGGMFVELAGTGFAAGATVAIGGSSCTSVSVVSATKMTCTTGSRAAATVDVVVTNTDTGVGTLTNGFTYGTNSFHVERVYPTYNGSIDSWNWNYYVDGSTNTSDCNVTTSTTCIHAGEKRKVVTGRTSCAGLTMTDNLGVFSWTCAVTNSIATFTTTGFNPGKGLAHLLDATDFKNNYPILNDGGSINGTSAKWWNNTVGALPAAVTVQTLSTAGKIYTLAASDTGNGYWIAADRIALVTLPGTTLTWGDSATASCHGLDGSTTGATFRCIVSVGQGSNNSRSFAWIEGTFDGNAATNDATYGTFFAGAKFSRGHRINATGSDYGLVLLSSSYNSLSQITASTNTTNGILITNSSSNNTLTGATISSNGGSGLNISSSSSTNTLTQIQLESNGGAGMIVSTDNNILGDVYSSGNANGGGFVSGGKNNSFKNMNISNNGSFGFSLSGGARNNKFIKSTLSNNAYGIRFAGGSNNNIFSHLTVTNSTNYGIDVTGSSSNTFNQVTVTNNSYGIFSGWGSNFTQTAISNNTNYGIHFNSNNSTFLDSAVAHNDFGLYFDTGSDNNDVLGRLLVGNNSTGDCEVDGGSTNGNITEGAFQACNTVDPNLTITSAVSLAASFRGLTVDGDDSNADDASIDAGNGILAFASVTDWVNFENIFRGWGNYANVTPTNSGNQGRCTAGNCGLWDWSLAVGDNGAGGTPVLADRSSCPSGAVYGTHTWSDNSTTNYLLYATEQIDDGIGNDNALCESSETCIYAPNIGSYQGHGTLAASSGLSGCPNIGTGATIQNVTLLEYPTNGY